MDTETNFVVTVGFTTKVIYGVGLRINRSSVRIRPWPLRWVLGQGSLLPLSQGEAFTLASISYLAILVKYILAKKKKVDHQTTSKISRDFRSCLMIDLGRETDGNNEICLGVHFALCIIKSSTTRSYWALFLGRWSPFFLILRNAIFVNFFEEVFFLWMGKLRRLAKKKSKHLLVLAFSQLWSTFLTDGRARGRGYGDGDGLQLVGGTPTGLWRLDRLRITPLSYVLALPTNQPECSHTVQFVGKGTVVLETFLGD